VLRDEGFDAPPYELETSPLRRPAPEIAALARGSVPTPPNPSLAGWAVALRRR
jgi:hypothetical protein